MTRCWNKKLPIVSESCPKRAIAVFMLKVSFFTKYFGYVCNKICIKIFQKLPKLVTLNKRTNQRIKVFKTMKEMIDIYLYMYWFRRLCQQELQVLKFHTSSSCWFDCATQKSFLIDNRFCFSYLRENVSRVAKLNQVN